MMCRIKKSIWLVLAAAGIVFAQNAPQWQNLYPAYNGLAFGADKFVAVSGDGLIRTTADGEKWGQSAINGDDDANSRRVIYAAAYGGGQFVALQNSSKYLHSADGNVWMSDPTALPKDVAWKSIIYGAGSYGKGFVAVAASGRTEFYDDEEEWGLTADANIALSHVGYGAGKFVVVGDGIKWSGDARGWGVTEGASAQIAAVAFGGGKFAALSKNGANAYTSEDGQKWTSVSASGAAADMADMVFGGGKFVAVGKAGKGCFSSDGTSWKSFTLNPDDDFTAVKYGAGAFLALGAKGSVYKSGDGETWNRLYGNSVTSYKQIAFGNNKYVAVGDSGVSVSPDGLKWERKSSAAKNLNGVAFGANRFVAVGDNGAIFTSAGDGETWTDNSKGDDIFTSVAFGGTNFIAGGRTPEAEAQSKVVVYTSADGESWTSYNVSDLTGWATSGQYIASLASGDGKFLAAVGGTTNALKICDITGTDIGRWWTSLDNKDESNKKLPSASDGFSLTSAVYADNKFVVLGTKKTTGEAVIINSADAENGWTAVSIPDIKGLKSATYAKNTFFAAGDSGNIYAQLNGAWYLQNKATNRNLSTIYSVNGVMLAAGAGGAMLYSNAEPTSIKRASTPRAAVSSKDGVMRLNRFGRTPVVTLSFTPNSAGTVAVYSLSGRQLYKTRLGVGERSASLPERAISSGSVIVRYSGNGMAVSQRFQFVR